MFLHILWTKKIKSKTKNKVDTLKENKRQSLCCHFNCHLFSGDQIKVLNFIAIREDFRFYRINKIEKISPALINKINELAESSEKNFLVFSFLHIFSAVDISGRKIVRDNLKKMLNIKYFTFTWKISKKEIPKRSKLRKTPG